MSFQSSVLIIVFTTYCVTFIHAAACGEFCNNNNECTQGSCTYCSLQGICTLGNQCGASCNVTSDCNGDTCGVCAPSSPTSSSKQCFPACGQPCSSRAECNGFVNWGCGNCVNGVCSKGTQCGGFCNTSDQCGTYNYPYCTTCSKGTCRSLCGAPCLDTGMCDASSSCPRCSANKVCSPGAGCGIPCAVDQDCGNPHTDECWACIQQKCVQRPWIEFMQPQQGSWTRWTNVTARFGGVAPVPDDWIGVFLSTWPATYVQWFRVLGSNTSVPVSNMTFNLLNSRDGYYARYYRADVLMAQSNVVYPDGSYPTHSRLVLTPEGIRMSWTSNRTTPSSTIARFGMQSDLSDAVTIPAQSSTYTQEDIVRCLGYPNPIPIRTTPFPNIHHHTFTCAKHHHKACTGDDIAARLFFPPGYFHNVTIPLRGLVGGKRYYYAVGELGGYMSNVMSFVCPPDASSDSVSVLYTADVGIGSMEPYETGSAIHN
eukprot:PhF_6_TR11661/c4_g2_i4/m.18836